MLFRLQGWPLLPLLYRRPRSGLGSIAAKFSAARAFPFTFSLLLFECTTKNGIRSMLLLPVNIISFWWPFTSICIVYPLYLSLCHLLTALVNSKDFHPPPWRFNSLAAARRLLLPSTIFTRKNPGELLTFAWRSLKRIKYALTIVSSVAMSLMSYVRELLELLLEDPERINENYIKWYRALLVRLLFK